MRIRLSDERKRDLVASIQAYCREHFDDDVGELRAERLLDFFVKELGPPVYNQAIQDAHDFIADKLTDLQGEFYEPESDGR